MLAAKLEGKVCGDGRISGVIDGVFREGDKEGESARKRRGASGVGGPEERLRVGVDESGSSREVRAFILRCKPKAFGLFDWRERYVDGKGIPTRTNEAVGCREGESHRARRVCALVDC
jgi:hypothetical protein